MSSFLAIDIGAESGRVILGILNGENFSFKEIHRFANGMLFIQNKYYWNIGQLYKEIVTGFEICVQKEKVQPESIGIDTWGVDYGLLAKDGTLMGLPYAYRDPRTLNAIDDFTKIIPKERIYKLTGNLFAPYNTLFQLYAAKKSHPEIIHAAKDLLFMPDLLTYMLTGEKKTDISFASTSQLFNPHSRHWEKELFDALGISTSIMQDVVEPGNIVGELSDSICKQTGLNKIPVIAVATHDTNSAIAAIPATGKNWAFISSGTWSLMGYESEKPVITERTFQLNFSNEAGAGNTFDILKNHMGLWLLQQCRQSWKNDHLSYSDLMKMAENAKPFLGQIDVDDNCFLNPPDMPKAIIDHLKTNNQTLPENKGQMIRIILESLALKYRQTLQQIKELKEDKPDEIFITGGGINNEILCQYTANSTGVPVRTGLVEGTAAGNILLQAMGKGHAKSLKEARELISNSTESKTYYPEDTDIWDEQAYGYPL
jgi:rhamnulokinase